MVLFNSWGAAAMCAGAVHNLAGIITARAFLGVFEAAFGAGAPYFLSLFYQRRELGKRISILLSMSPLANCFASSLAYGIFHIRGSLAPWRLLFIIGEFELTGLDHSYVVLCSSCGLTKTRLASQRVLLQLLSLWSSTSSSRTHPVPLGS